MGLKHTTDSDTHLKRHRRHLPWFQRGVSAQGHMGMARLLFYRTQVITGHGFRGNKGWAHTAHTTSGTVSTLSGRGYQDQPCGPCPPSHLPIPSHPSGECGSGWWKQLSPMEPSKEVWKWSWHRVKPQQSQRGMVPVWEAAEGNEVAAKPGREELSPNQAREAQSGQKQRCHMEQSPSRAVQKQVAWCNVTWFPGACPSLLFTVLELGTGSSDCESTRHLVFVWGSRN